MLYAINAVGLQSSAGTPVGVGNPNISAPGTVTIISGGSIGELAAPAQICLGSLSNPSVCTGDLRAGTLSSQQAGALAIANAPGDVTLTGTDTIAGTGVVPVVFSLSSQAGSGTLVGTDASGQTLAFTLLSVDSQGDLVGVDQNGNQVVLTTVAVAQTAPFFIDVLGVLTTVASTSIQSPGATYLQSTTQAPLKLGSVTAGGDVSITAPGSINSAGTSAVQVTTAGNLRLLAGSGDLAGSVSGDTITPLVLDVAGQLRSAVAGGNVSLQWNSGDLRFGRITAGKSVALYIPSGGLYQTTPGIIAIGGSALSVNAATQVGTAVNPVELQIPGQVNITAPKGVYLGTIGPDSPLSVGRIAATAGDVTLGAQGDVTLGQVIAQGTATIDASGTISEVGDANPPPTGVPNPNANVIAANAVLQSLKAVGASAAPVETSVGRLVSSSSGPIWLVNYGDLVVGAVPGSSVAGMRSNGALSLADHGSLTVEQPVDSAGGPITITADGTITDAAPITSEGGAVALQAGQNVQFTATGSIDVGSGTPQVTVTALGSTAPGDVTMAPGSLINGAGGPIEITGLGDVTLTDVTSTGAVTATSTNGSILDGNAGSAVDITGGQITLTAGAMIGQASDPLLVDHTGAGDIGPLTAGTGLYLTQTNGPLQIATATAKTGDVVLTVANAGAGPHDLILADPTASVTAMGGSITLSTPGGDITLDPGSSVSALTTVTGAAGGAIDISGSAVTAATGAMSLTAQGDVTVDATSTLGAGATMTLDGGQNGSPASISLSGSLTAPLIEVHAGDGGDLVTLAPVALNGYTQLWGGAGNDTFSLTLPSIDTTHITDSALTGPGALINGTTAQDALPGMTRSVQGVTLPLRNMVDVNGAAGNNTYDIHLSGVTGAAPQGTSYIVNVNNVGTPTGVDTLNVDLPVAQANDLLIRAGFVALVHPLPGNGAAGPYTPYYERINYNPTVGLTLNGGQVGDHFFFVDNGAPTTVNAGNGDNTFQFGGLFGSPQTAAGGNVAVGDSVSTVQTTAGYLSRGISYATTVNGGNGADTWVLYSWQAPLNLIAGTGDNGFQVRAFALVGPPPADHLDAPLAIVGNGGHDSLLVVGTSLSEQFVISSTQVLGAGLNISYRGLDWVQVNGGGGSDTFTVLSTAAGAVTQLDGGISGSDTFNVAADVIVPPVADTAAGTPVIAAPLAGPQNTGGLAGELVIDGTAVPAPDLVAGVRLPTELDTPLPVLPSQQADPNRIATLNVFNDQAPAGQTGTLGQISAGQYAALGVLLAGAPAAALPLADFGAIGGLGMSAAGSLSLGASVSPSALSLDGGIVYGSIDVVDLLLGSTASSVATENVFTVTATARNTITVVQGGGGYKKLVATGGGGYYSPLILLGNTTQDGSFYNSTPGSLTGGARIYASPGQSVIDASLDPNNVIIYGGVGDSMIFGGGGGDQIFGGSGSDLIQAGSGNDIIHANDGINLDLSHTLAQDIAGNLPAMTVVNQPDGPPASPTADPLYATSDQIYAGMGHDIIIMDHGIVDQLNNPITGTQGVIDAYTVDPITVGLSSVFGAYNGSAVVLAGSGPQTINLGHTKYANVVVKNGYVYFAGPDSWIGKLAKVGSTAPGAGGRDTITLGNGNDIVVAGTGFDRIIGGGGNKIVLGDDGQITWKANALVSIVSQDPSVSLHSTQANTITLGNGNDIVFGGSGANTITLGTGNDIVVGADGQLTFAAGVPQTLQTIYPTYGGANSITVGGADGVVIGGPGANVITVGPGAVGASNAVVFGIGSASYDPATGAWVVVSPAPAIAPAQTGAVTGPAPTPTVSPAPQPSTRTTTTPPHRARKHRRHRARKHRRHAHGRSGRGHGGHGRSGRGHGGHGRSGRGHGGHGRSGRGHGGRRRPARAR